MAVSLRKFNYTNSKGEKHSHIVYALSETPDYLMGIDVNKALELVVDKHDKDFKGDGHSPWCYNLILATIDFAKDDEPTYLKLNDASLVGLAAAEAVWETEHNVSKPEYQAYYDELNNLILYNDDHTPIDKDKLVKLIDDRNIVNGKDLTDAIDKAAMDDSDEYYLFARNLNWFSLVHSETYESEMPGFQEMRKRYQDMQKVLLMREPTQYKDLKESRAAGKQKIAGFDEEWMKAFKNFKKSGIEE